jgi:nicotinamidase/pyrazinamidase
MDENTALLVIDVQNSATAADGKVTVGSERCDAPIENMNSLIELASRESWDIYYVAHVTPWYHFLPAAVTHFAFMKGSEGALFDRRLDVVNQAVFTKMFGSALSNFRLRRLLKDTGVRSVVLCGLATDACVFASAKSAKSGGYDVTVVSDACVGRTDEAAAEACAEMDARGILIARTSELLPAAATVK